MTTSVRSFGKVLASPGERPRFFRDLLAHVGFSLEDSAALSAARPSDERLQGVVEHFYSHLMSQDATRRIIDQDGVVARLQQTLFEWLAALFQGPHDEEYFERRCRIGRRHVQIGLEQHHMFTAMALIREDLAWAIEGAFQSRPEQRIRSLRALHKLLDLELAVMVESYREERFELELLRDSERKYRDLIENAPEMILTVDREGRIQHINRTALDLLGYADEEVPERLADLLVPAERERTWRLVLPVLEGRAEPAQEFETRFLERSGEVRIVRVRVAGVQRQAEPTVRIFVQDVTEARRLEAQMAEYARQVEEKRRLAAIGQMVAGIAHELRTPLQVVTTGLDSIIQAVPTSGFEREIARTKEGIRRVRGFIQEILDYSKEVHLDRSQFEPATLIGSVLADLGEEIERAKIRVSTWFHPQLGRVDADAFRIKQVLVNLLQNAIEAVPAGGSIDVEARPIMDGETPSIEFTIRDTGRGIPEGSMTKIFIPFFTTKPRGTGLGLAIVQRIVNAHGGRIDVKSKLGDGTEVRIRIPVEAK